MGGKPLRKALDDYKTIYMAYRNFAERTREEYLNDLQDFVGYLEKSGIEDVRKIGLPAIERYVAALEQNGYASLTRKRKVVTIRSFLSFLYQDGYIASNIAKKVILPYTESTTPQILTRSECDRLRSASTGKPRDNAIIELLLQTGIKLSELLHLTVDDIEFERTNEKTSGYLRIVGSRGKKDRLIPLNSSACQVLKKYIGVRKGKTNRTLFLNRFDGPLQDRGLQKMLRKYLKWAGIGQASIHTLRHTFGAYHVARGTDPRTVQDVMGLKDARSAAIYQSLAREVVSRELEENALQIMDTTTGNLCRSAGTNQVRDVESNALGMGS